MSKLGRKIRRKQEKKRKREAQRDLAQKTALFGHLGDECLICNESFDKTDKEMVKSWYVIVREKEEKVNLYCPPCWNSALQNIQDIQKAMAEVKSENSFNWRGGRLF